jgi:hypothetical protein
MKEEEYHNANSGLKRSYLKICLIACLWEVLGQVWNQAHRHTTSVCLASSLSNIGGSRLCSCTPSDPWARRTHRHRKPSWWTWASKEAWPHPCQNFFKGILCVFALVHKYPILDTQMSHLKPKEEVELSHHAHLKFTAHNI